jgi:hypothetical protein
MRFLPAQLGRHGCGMGEASKKATCCQQLLQTMRSGEAVKRAGTGTVSFAIRLLAQLAAQVMNTFIQVLKLVALDLLGFGLRDGVHELHIARQHVGR